MDDASFQEALSKYGIDQNLMSQEHGAARANMLDALGVPAAELQRINAHISQTHRDARQAAGPARDAGGVVSGADSRSAFNDSQVDSSARGGGGIQQDTPGTAARDDVQQAQDPNRRTREQQRSQRASWTKK
jgi:hypothetical protein